MRPISVFEHTTISAPPTDAERRILESLCRRERKQMFEFGLHQVKTTSYVGVVQLPDRTLQILPKMYREDETKEVEATANLLFLLSYTRKLEITEPEIARLTEQRTSLPEILYWIFAHRLWDAVRREVLRGYVTIEDRLEVLKGRWLITAQARRPDGWRRDRFDMAFDEFTEDNLPNRLFKATVARLSRCAKCSDTLSKLTQLNSVFADVADHTPRLQDFDAANHWMVSHRSHSGASHIYQPLLNLTRLFLIGAGPQPSPGQLDTFAFMFDMNQLFEEFIAEFIHREMRDMWHSREWMFHAQSGNRYLLSDEQGRDCFKLVPDIRFASADGTCLVIVDTKYKLLGVDDSKTSIAEADVYQMFAYKERYRCPRVILLYPQGSRRIARDFSADADSPPWLEVRTVDLRTDLIGGRADLRKDLSETLFALNNTEITI